MTSDPHDIDDIIDADDVLEGQDPKFPHARFPNALTLDPGIRPRALSAEAKILWAVIDTFKRRKESAWPGQERLAEEMGVSERSVRRWINELRTHGWLKIQPRLRQGRKVGNRYFLMVINPEAGDRIRADRARRAADRTELAGSSERPNVAGRQTDRTGLSADRTELAGPKKKQYAVEKQYTENYTPPTPLTEGGAIEVIEGTIGGEDSTTDPLRGHVWSAKLTRRGGAPTDVERQAAGEVFEAWVESPTVLGGQRRAGAVLTGKRVEVIVHRLRDGYSAADLADACRGWTRLPHNRGENERGTRYDALDLLLRDGDHVERFRDAWREDLDPMEGIQRAALMRQAVRNPMLAAAKAIAPGGMERGPEHHPAVKDAVDAATLRWREDEYRAGREPTERMPPEMERRVVEEAVAALAVPC